MQKSKAAVYCRLSIEDGNKTSLGDDSESIRNQKLLLTEFCASQGFEIHNVYSDDDYSGLDRDRPGFNQMLRDAEKGLFSVIVCKTQSRFTRDMELVEKYIHGLFALWRIRFIGVVDNVDTSIKGGKKSRQINALVNEWYSEDLSENIRAVFRRKMLDGQFLGSFAPYGYSKSLSDRHKLEVDEEASVVVRDIFGLYLKGYGCAQICDILTSENILTPSNYKKSKNFKYKNPNSGKSESLCEWSPNTVKRILRNETYIGRLVQGKEHKLSYKSKKVTTVSKSEWIIVDGCHNPIIDEKTFYNVQGLMDRKRRSSRNAFAVKSVRVGALAGKIVCLDCGNALHIGGTSRNGEARYLRCGYSHRTRNCTPHSIKLEDIELLVTERINKMVQNFLGNDENLHGVFEDICTEIVSSERLLLKGNELHTCSERIKDILSATASAYIDKAKGVISETDFINMKGIFDEEIDCLKEKKARIEKCRTPRYSELPKNAEELLKISSGFNLLTPEIVNNFIDNIQIGEKDKKGEMIIIINWLI